MRLASCRAGGALLAVTLLLLPALGACARGGTPAGNGLDGTSGLVELTASAEVEIVAELPPLVARVQPVPSVVALSPGGTAVLTATAYDEQGRPLEQGVEFRWFTRNPGAGSMSASGVFRAGEVPGVYENAIEVQAIQRVGEREFTATGRATVIVLPREGDRVMTSGRVIPPLIQVAPGDSVHLQAVGVDSQGLPITSVRVSWEVAEPRAGSITADGDFTAGRRPGFYPQTVKATLFPAGAGSPVTAYADVEVLAPVQLAEGVRLVVVPARVVATPGQTVRLRADAVDSSGRTLTIKSAVWRVLVPEAGTVTPDGVFTAGRLAGNFTDAVEVEADIATDFGVVTTRARVGVSVVQVEALTPVAGVLQRASVVPELVRLKPGQSQRLAVLGLDGTGRVVPNLEVEWQSGSEAVQVDASGNVTAVGSPGRYASAVRAMVRQRGTGREVVASATVVVLGTLSRLQIIPERAVVEPGERVPFRAVAYDENGEQIFDVTFNWEAREEAGRIDDTGVFVAGDRPGVYPDAVRVRAVQSRR